MADAWETSRGPVSLGITLFLRALSFDRVWTGIALASGIASLIGYAIFRDSS